MWRILVLSGVTLSFVALACSSSSKSAACAGGSEATFREQATLFSWPVYCPTFLPAGASLDRADFGPSPTGGLSEVTFKVGSGETIRVIQGHILVSPRSGQGFAEPMQHVSFGDVPAQLFITNDGPMVRQVAVSAEDITRALLGSSSIDRDALVKIAEGMRRVD